MRLGKTNLQFFSEPKALYSSPFVARGFHSSFLFFLLLSSSASVFCAVSGQYTRLGLHPSALKIFWEVFLAISAAELGDKSMVATVTLSTSQDAPGVFLGKLLLSPSAPPSPHNGNEIEKAEEETPPPHLQMRRLTLSLPLGGRVFCRCNYKYVFVYTWLYHLHSPLFSLPGSPAFFCMCSRLSSRYFENPLSLCLLSCLCIGVYADVFVRRLSLPAAVFASVGLLMCGTPPAGRQESSSLPVYLHSVRVWTWRGRIHYCAVYVYASSTSWQSICMGPQKEEG